MEPVFCQDRVTCNQLRKYLVRVIAAKAKDVFDIDIDVEYTVSQFPVIRKTVYPLSCMDSMQLSPLSMSLASLNCTRL